MTHSMQTGGVTHKFKKRVLVMIIMCLIIMGLSFFLLQQFNKKKKLEAEFTRIVWKAAHDIGSPLAALEMIAQSTSIALSTENKTMIRQAATRVRDTMDTLLKHSEKLIAKSDQ